jgi:S1-C subfamily serine protease
VIPAGSAQHACSTGKTYGIAHDAGTDSSVADHIAKKTDPKPAGTDDIGEDAPVVHERAENMEQIAPETVQEPVQENEDEDYGIAIEQEVSNASAKAAFSSYNTVVLEECAASTVQIAVRTESGTAMFANGFCINGAGDIVTCEHVFCGREENSCYIIRNDGMTVPATLVVSSHDDDLAIVRAKSHDEIDWTSIGSYGEAQVGEQIAVIGRMPSAEEEISLGTVTDIGIDTECVENSVAYRGLIASTNKTSKGNSGGPAVDCVDGHLVGMLCLLTEGASYHNGNPMSSFIKPWSQICDWLGKVGIDYRIDAKPAD